MFDEFQALLKEGNAEKIASFAKENGIELSIKDGKIIPKQSGLEDFWDTRQYVRKILLNSLYGALLNEYSLFFDQRIGQSVTLTGRNITKHMSSKINELVTNDYNHMGDTIKYGDTDSTYFSLYDYFQNNNIEFDWNNVEAIIELYDALAEQTNETFGDFMKQTFNVPPEQSVIAAGREIVAKKAYFIKKKRYAALMIDKEGKRQDTDGKPGKLKAMGLDLKRSDTPEHVQKFLEKNLIDLLSGKSKDDLFSYIKKYRDEFRELPSWEKGTPKKVNGLTDYWDSWKSYKKDGGKKPNMPGHVMASINWNEMRVLMDDKNSMEIQDGQKIIVCKLSNNEYQMTSIGYPIDEQHLPQWFKDLPFDDEAMEETIIDKKLENLYGTICELEGWDLQDTKSSNSFDDFFF